MHRYRITFMTGLAAGFVIGTRAGRERYEQMRQLARKAADSPTVQQAAGAVQAQVTGALQSARRKVTDRLGERVPRMAESARHAVADRMPGRRDKDTHLENGASSSESPFASDSGHASAGTIS